MNNNNTIITALTDDELALLISMRDQYQNGMKAVLESPGCGGDLPKSYPVIESKIAVMTKIIDAAIDADAIAKSDPRKQRVEPHHLVRTSFQGREITGEVTRIGRVAATGDHSAWNTLLTIKVDDPIDDEPYYVARESDVEIFGVVPQYIHS